MIEKIDDMDDETLIKYLRGKDIEEPYHIYLMPEKLGNRLKTLIDLYQGQNFDRYSIFLLPLEWEIPTLILLAKDFGYRAKEEYQFPEIYPGQKRDIIHELEIRGIKMEKNDIPNKE